MDVHTKEPCEIRQDYTGECSGMDITDNMDVHTKPEPCEIRQDGECRRIAADGLCLSLVWS